MNAPVQENKLVEDAALAVRELVVIDCTGTPSIRTAGYAAAKGNIKSQVLENSAQK
jgi:hypothetical protein